MKAFTIHFRILFIFSAALALSSCDSNRIVDESTSINVDGWSKNDVKSFQFAISDTTSLYNIFINVRNSSDYEYSNLYLFIEMTSPSNKFFTDTVELTLADSKGKWHGKGIGNIWQNQLVLIQKVKLLENGLYNVQISQGMRNDTLKAITDIGLRVETVK